MIRITTEGMHIQQAAGQVRVSVDDNDQERLNTTRFPGTGSDAPPQETAGREDNSGADFRITQTPPAPTIFRSGR
jgi:hypothetical protein